MRTRYSKRATQAAHLQAAVESGALDLAGRRASLDAGHGLTGDEVLARVLEHRIKGREQPQHIDD